MNSEQNCKAYVPPLWFRIIRTFLAGNAFLGLTASVFMPALCIGFGMAIDNPESESLYIKCMLIYLGLLPIVCIVTLTFLFRTRQMSLMQTLFCAGIFTALLGFWFPPLSLPVIQKTCTKIKAWQAVNLPPASTRP
ncbi:hypothetical protein HKD21_03265 [Gluconobacter cerevisiae]|uniref:Uncharacterized protein n=1 Tax=Gluconobacter cerevisiae TaxID=1379734 RepID=A0ABR9YBK7_9PROT|nr:hypothetical protein [Gluconobacter cerevisiae]MBF0875866.1 hypothetical protein [Gluconobacter cerevisiae]